MTELIMRIGNDNVSKEIFDKSVFYKAHLENSEFVESRDVAEARIGDDVVIIIKEILKDGKHIISGCRSAFIDVIDDPDAFVFFEDDFDEITLDYDEVEFTLFIEAMKMWKNM